MKVSIILRTDGGSSFSGTQPGFRQLGVIYIDGLQIV